MRSGRDRRHWDANTLESSDGYTRHSFDSNASNFVLQDSYFPAFRTAIRQGGARGIMCVRAAAQTLFWNHLSRISSALCHPRRAV